MTPSPGTVTVTFEGHGQTVSMQIDGTRGDDNLLGLAIREAVKNTGGTIPRDMVFHGRPGAQSLYAQFSAAYSGTALVADNVAEVIDVDDDLGVYRNAETGKLEVWIDKQTVFGGEFPDTEEGLVAAARQAQEMRASRVS